MNRTAEGRTKQLDCNLLFDGVALKAYTKEIDGKEFKFIGGTASSTAKDLYGDIIGAEGQVKMLEKLKKLASDLATNKSGLTGWLNHSYKIPEDTLGAFVNASLTTREDGGETFIDLDIELRLTETNPRALAAWEQVKDGIRHGWSIGAYFLEAEWLSDDPDSPDFWSLYVTDVNLLEISLVGIPANQRAWCRSAEDLKAKAVEVATSIARSSALAGKRDALTERRSLVLKSLVANEAEVEAAESVVKSDAPVDEPASGAADTASAEASTSTEDATQPPPEAKTEVQAGVPPSAGADATGALPEQRSTLIADLRARAASIPDDASFDAASEIRAALLGAAAALEQKGSSPDDDRDLIGMAVSHMTKAVGHGLCVKSAAHVAKALECMSAIIGGDAGSGGPDGDEDPDEKSAQLIATFGLEIAKLEPKAGDVLFLRVPDLETMSAIESSLNAAKLALPDGVGFLCMSGDMALTIDNDLAEKQRALEKASTDVALAETLLTETLAKCESAETKSKTATAELQALETKIEAAKSHRLGHKSLQAGDIPSLGASEVLPEHYEMNQSQQREALARSMTGGASVAARDALTAQ